MNLQPPMEDHPERGPLTKQAAEEMVKAYSARSAEKNPAEKNTKCVWFSLEQMDRILTLLKAEKLSGKGTDGLRVYFAQYTEKTAGGDKHLIGKNTVVFVSTRADGKMHQDYFDNLKLASYMLPENRGELCQPHCTGTEL
jgi:hypothetical protein